MEFFEQFLDIPKMFLPSTDLFSGFNSRFHTLLFLIFGVLLDLVKLSHEHELIAFEVSKYSFVVQSERGLLLLIR